MRGENQNSLMELSSTLLFLYTIIYSFKENAFSRMSFMKGVFKKSARLKKFNFNVHLQNKKNFFFIIFFLNVNSSCG